MKKTILLAVSMIAILLVSAQKKVNYVQLAADFGIPTGDFAEGVNVGFGIGAKALMGVTEEGQITFGSGYTRYGVKELPPDIKASFFIIPILLGYRHNFNGLYIEPQVGMGIYGARASAGGVSDSNSESAFTWAAGFGYTSRGLDIGLRYQSGKINDADAAFSLVGIHFGYNFLLKGGSRR